jgi:hypothetical protein
MTATAATFLPSPIRDSVVWEDATGGMRRATGFVSLLLFEAVRTKERKELARIFIAPGADGPI